MTADLNADSQMLFGLMRRFWGGFGRQMEMVLEEAGVNVPQYLAMTALSQSGVSTMGRLARDLHVTMGAATNIVDRLIRGGYVTRERGTDDRRIVRVKLQPKGQETLREIEENATAFVSNVLSELDGEQRTQFLGVFERMVGVAEGTLATASRE